MPSSRRERRPELAGVDRHGDAVGDEFEELGVGSMRAAGRERAEELARYAEVPGALPK